MPISNGFSRRSFIASTAGATAALLTSPSSAQDVFDNMGPQPRTSRSVTIQRLQNVRVLNAAKIPKRKIATQLVVCIDSSWSAGDGIGSNTQIQIEGIAGAFESDQLINTIEQRNGIGVTAIQFGERAAQIVPWMFVSNREESYKFADILLNSMENVGPDTGIVHGLAAAAGVLEYSPFNRHGSERVVVDVSGDGVDGVMPHMVKPFSVALTKEFSARVNGLVMRDPYITLAELREYYKNNVVTDANNAADACIPEGKLWEVFDTARFMQVMQSKLIEEIVGGVMPERPYFVQMPG